MASAANSSALLVETLPMYQQTLASVRQTVYGGPRPAWLVNTLGRWILTDPALRRKNGRLIVRDLPAEQARPSIGDVLVAVARGAWQDVRGAPTP